MIHRAIRQSPRLITVLVLLFGCSSDATNSTDGNTSFFGTCAQDSDCQNGLSCLCGVCSRTCTTATECSSLGDCVISDAAGLACSAPTRLCAPEPCTCPEGQECGPRFCDPGRDAGDNGGTGGENAGGSAGLEMSGDAGPEGGATATGGIGGGGTSNSGGSAGSGGAESSGGATGAGGADAGVDNDATSCPSPAPLVPSMSCSLDLCSTENGGMEIRLTTEGGWYIGALDWTMEICGVQSTGGRYPVGDNRTLAYAFTRQEFDALARDADIYMYYGAPSADNPRAAACGTLNQILSLPIPIGECQN